MYSPPHPIRAGFTPFMQTTPTCDLSKTKGKPLNRRMMKVREKKGVHFPQTTLYYCGARGKEKQKRMKE